MDIIISLFVLALVVVIVFLIIDAISLPPKIAQIAKLIIGVLALIAILKLVLPIFGISFAFPAHMHMRG